MNITLQGTHLELTDELRAYVDEKVHDALRAFGDMDLEPVDVAVELEVTSRHHRKDGRLFRAEANVTVPGRILRAEASSDNMYRAIVQLKHRLTREIRTWRERRTDRGRQGARVATDIPAEAETELASNVDVGEAWEAWDEAPASVDDAVDDEPTWDDDGDDLRDYV